MLIKWMFVEPETVGLLQWLVDHASGPGRAAGGRWKWYGDEVEGGTLMIDRETIQVTLLEEAAMLIAARHQLLGVVKGPASTFWFADVPAVACLLVRMRKYGFRVHPSLVADVEAFVLSWEGC
jgi:hypothetical protein